MSSPQDASKLHVMQIISFAGAFCAFVIGSGFATGQELKQFFTSYGTFGFGGLAISMVLFMWLIATCMAQGQQQQFAISTDIFKYNCGKILGTFFEYFVPIFLFFIVVIMFAGSKAAITESFGTLTKTVIDGVEVQVSSIPAFISYGVMPVAAFLSVLFGLRRLIQIIGTIGPIIIVAAIILGLYGIATADHSLSEAHELVAGLKMEQASSHWALSGFLYAIFIGSTVAPFVGSVGAQALNKRDALLGGLLGGFFMVAAAGVLSAALLLNVVRISAFEVPTLALAASTPSAMLGTGFSIILMLGIYTTAAPVLWTVCSRIAGDDSKYFKLVVVAVTLAAFVGSFFNFGVLVGTIYPYTGYLGTLFAICVLVKQLTGKSLP